MKLFEALKKAEEIFKNEGIDDFSSDARFLLQSCYELSSTDFVINREKEIDEKPFFKMVKKRVEGVPVQYIAGKCEFMSLEFEVNKNVLIPRQDTETVVEKIIEIYKGKKVKILDVCTGSGCIAISLAKYSDAEVFAFDISDEALKVAKRNAQINNVKVGFFVDDALNPKNELKDFDILVSNPPYIETEVINNLDETVKNNEPRLALDGGADGLEFYKKTAPYGKKVLKKGGMIFFEIGFNQGNEVLKILADNGFEEIAVVKDYNNNNRLVYGKKK